MNIVLDGGCCSKEMVEDSSWSEAAIKSCSLK